MGPVKSTASRGLQAIVQLLALFVPDSKAAGRSVVAIYGAEMDEKGPLISLGNDTMHFCAIQVTPRAD